MAAYARNLRLTASRNYDMNRQNFAPKAWLRSLSAFSATLCRRARPGTAAIMEVPG
jgi:hypothetical protein